MKVGDAELLTSASGRASWPPEGPPEFAFLGRSNVGKSSLLNRLVGRRKLARTSAAPGKTRLLNFFRVRGRRQGAPCEVVLVDLPGYGYARVARSERETWQGLVEAYLTGRRCLRAAVLLQDLRRDVSDDELDLVAWLAQHEVPVVVALTKCDKLKPVRRAARIRELGAAFPLPGERLVATSAQTGLGMDALWDVLESCLD